MHPNKETFKWFGNSDDVTAKLRLFCIPHAGGGVQSFLDWDKEFLPQISVCPVHLPGRGKRLVEPAYTCMEELIEGLLYALQSKLDKPFALFGHSMGALVAFELARALRRRFGVEPEWLFVSSHRAPHVMTGDKPIYALPDNAFIDAVKSYNGLPRELLVNSELMDLVLPILRADFELCDRYFCVDDVPLKSPIAAFGGLYDPKVKLDLLAAWCDHTRGEFAVSLLDGDHFYHQTQRRTLIRRIEVLLEQTLSEAVTQWA
ncbi:MAG: alpha/beta fold hydrolase [Candidatus Thiodiazotropha sp.]